MSALAERSPGTRTARIAKRGRAPSARLADSSLSRSVSNARIEESSPCFRRGVILQANAIYSDGRHRAIRRNALQAQKLGRLLVSHTDLFLDKIRGAILQGAKKSGILCGDFERQSDLVRSRFAPGLILDFPSHCFTIGKLRVHERTCITVCYDDSASKVWTRFILSHKPDEPITLDDLILFFNFCDKASSFILKSVPELYLELFRQENASRRKHEIAFDRLGGVEFIGVDSPVITPNLDTNFNSVSKDEARNFFDFYRCLVSKGSIRGYSTVLEQDIDLDMISDFESEFGYRAIFHGIFEQDWAGFLVMSENGRFNRDESFYESGALTAISELATLAARNF